MAVLLLEKKAMEQEQYSSEVANRRLATYLLLQVVQDCYEISEYQKKRIWKDQYKYQFGFTRPHVEACRIHLFPYKCSCPDCRYKVISEALNFFIGSDTFAVWFIRLGMHNVARYRELAREILQGQRNEETDAMVDRINKEIEKYGSRSSSGETEAPEKAERGEDRASA